MDAVYFWPDRPALSLLVLWGISVVALWTGARADVRADRAPREEPRGAARGGRPLVRGRRRGALRALPHGAARGRRARPPDQARAGVRRIETASRSASASTRACTAGSTTCSRRSSRTTSRARLAPTYPAGPARGVDSPNPAADDRTCTYPRGVRKVDRRGADRGAAPSTAPDTAERLEQVVEPAVQARVLAEALPRSRPRCGGTPARAWSGGRARPAASKRRAGALVERLGGGRAPAAARLEQLLEALPEALDQLEHRPRAPSKARPR